MRAYVNSQGSQGYPSVTRRYFRNQTITSTTSLVVPSITRDMVVTCVGAQGNGGAYGGYVKCNLITTPGETLYITIGTTTNAYNASDIRKGSNTLQARVIVAGGGGFGSYAGAGGGLTGGTGSSTGYVAAATGGTQSSGGAGGYIAGGDPRSGINGTAGTFGNGGTGWTTGGAGWYGGGGGSTWDIRKIGVKYGGSGGGSSYTNPSYCYNVVHAAGAQAGNGYVILNYEVPEGYSYDYYTEEGATVIVRNE